MQTRTSSARILRLTFGAASLSTSAVLPLSVGALNALISSSGLGSDIAT